MGRGAAVNTARQTVSGLDLTAAYGFTRDRDRFDLSLNATWLLRYDRQVTPQSPVTDQLDLAGHPVDLRGRATGAWSRGSLGASFTLSYVDDYRDGFGGRVGSWTTADAQVRWTSRDDHGPLRGLSAAFTVQNLFDAAPPFYDSFQGVGFDAANADALGRVASLQLTRRW